jgi:hypothetical protein
MAADWYEPKMIDDDDDDDECEAVGGMRIDRGKQNSSEKTCPSASPPHTHTYVMAQYVV